jgi:hypothetical protein
MSEINPSEPTQSEKREVLRNDTYFARQQNTIDDAGGRYSKLNPAKITGSTPASYPQQPASSPWSQGTDQITGVEPPFGIDVNELPPNSGGGQYDVVVGVGVEALPSADDLGGPVAPSDAALSPDVEISDPPIFSSKDANDKR